MMKTILGIAACATALALAGAAAAGPPGENGEPALDLPLDQDLTTAALTGTPNNEDLQREYPRVPLLMNLSGAASMSCKVLTSGSLANCHVVAEEPEGLGFGAATIRTAVYFHVRPATKDGVPVEGQITIPLRWQTDGHAPPPPPVELPPAPAASLTLARRILDLQGVKASLEARTLVMLEQQTAQTLARNNAPEKAHAMLDAFRLGLEDASEAEVDRQAHELAAHMTEADLRATLAFLQAPSGQDWIAATKVSADHSPKDFYARIYAAAWKRYCPNDTCPDGTKLAAQ